MLCTILYGENKLNPTFCGWSLQVPLICISPANLVVWGSWRSGFQLPCRDLQPVLQASSWQVFNTFWPPCLLLGANPWLGQEACTVSVIYIRWSARRVPVLLRRAWKLDLVPRWWFRCVKLWTANQTEVLASPDRLHSYKRWSVRRFSCNISKGLWARKGDQGSEMSLPLDIYIESPYIRVVEKYEQPAIFSNWG